MEENDIWLEIKDVDAFNNGNLILSSISLKLRRLDNTIILGPNGSGKSSLVNLINRNIYPIIKKGSYLKLFNEQLINIWKLRSSISTVSTDLDKRINLTNSVMDTVISGLFGSTSLKGLKVKKKYIKKANDIIVEYGLEDIANQSYGSLSDGTKRKVLIARAIVNKPKVLILDEPTEMLDISSRYKINRLLSNISAKGTSLLIVSHRPENIIKEINKIILIKNGKIIGTGKPSKVLKSKTISKLYDIPIKVVKIKNDWKMLVL